MISVIGYARNQGPALGLAVHRVTLGAVFLAHGLQKLTEWGWQGGVPFFAEAGIPLAVVAAPLVTVIEILGGGALIVGLATRAAGIILAIVMVVALVAVHWHHGFFLPNGIEFVLVLAAGNLTVALAGPGSPSVDGWISARAPQGVAGRWR